MASKINKNFLLILILLFQNSYCSIDNKNGFPENNGPPGDDKKPEKIPKGPSEDEINREEDKLKNDYEEKMKENLLLKQQIENKLKYIKILFVTGVIMLLIIIFIIIKICIGKRKKKNNIESKVVELKNSPKNNLNSNHNIEDSGFNIIKSNKDLSKISNESNNSNIDNNHENIINNSNSDLNEIQENNLNLNRLEDISKENINDDNKTLTNNPDIFISSKTDKILYQPYSQEEIDNNDKNK